MVEGSRRGREGEGKERKEEEVGGSEVKEEEELIVEVEL